MIISSLPFQRGDLRTCISALNLLPAGEMSDVGELKIISARLAERDLIGLADILGKIPFCAHFYLTTVIFIGHRLFLAS